MYNYQELLTEFGEKAKKIPLRVFADLTKTDRMIQLEQIALLREIKELLEQNKLTERPSSLAVDQEPTLEYIKELAAKLNCSVIPKRKKIVLEEDDENIGGTD